MSTNHNLFEENGEPKQYRTEVLPLTLGHTGSQVYACIPKCFYPPDYRPRYYYMCVFDDVSRFGLAVKPVLNWANVRSPNILRGTLRRIMIRFLIELLVRRTWFGQSKLYFVLKWLVMRCTLRPELAADAQQTA